MLILTRRPTQTVQIGNDVTITILEIRGAQVRIGVDAPANTHVLRGELTDKSSPGRRPSDARS